MKHPPGVKHTPPLYIVGVGLVLRGATHMDVSSRLAHFGVAIYIAEQAFG